ncbi:unnamed protein product [Moneuplotes crassus]|uniref:Uncharacterized protein n=1 Tax=Euplotes crassus TaxID=5936 RepID=A0AAD2DCK6_EUPCR|nr:unnamed protein product [Moneuplotes crassus]
MKKTKFGNLVKKNEDGLSSEDSSEDMNLKKITQAFGEAKNQRSDNKVPKNSEEILSYLPREQQILRRYERNNTQKIEEMEKVSQFRPRITSYIGIPTPHSAKPKKSLTSTLKDEEHLVSCKHIRKQNYQITESEKGLDKVRQRNQRNYIEMITEFKNEEIKKSQNKEKLWIGILVTFTIIQCCMNVTACLLYIISDYSEDDYINYAELGIAFFFAMEMAGSFYFYPSPKIRFFISIDTWVDFCTIMPEFLSVFLSSSNTNSVSFLRILRILKIMRIVKFKKTLKKIQLKKVQEELTLDSQVETLSRLKKQLIMLIISLFATLFICSGIITVMEQSFEKSMSEPLKFIDSFYYVVITATTIGYGDIYPTRSQSRIIVAIILIIIFMIFGDQISKIIAIMKDSDKYDIKYNMKSHTILVGNRCFSIITPFLHDALRNAEHEESKILIIDDVSMTDRMEKLLDYEAFQGRVYFLSVRNGITHKTFIKCCANKASSIFIISDPYSISGEDQDKKGLFMKTYLRNNGVNCPIYIQLSLYDDKYLENFITKNEITSNQSMYDDQIDDEEDEADDIKSACSYSGRKLVSPLPTVSNKPDFISAICYRKFKFNLLAQSMFSQGLLPFVTCFLIDSPIQLSEIHKREPQLSSVDKELSIPNKLCKLYNRSLEYNLYIIDLPFMCENFVFEDAVKKIDLLETHPLFVSTGTKLKLIGLIEHDVDENNLTIDSCTPRNLYAPFGSIISYSHKGIYICNNPKITSWLEKKSDSERLLRETMKNDKDRKKKNKISHFDNNALDKEESIAFSRIQTRVRNQERSQRDLPRSKTSTAKRAGNILIEDPHSNQKDKFLFGDDEPSEIELEEAKQPILELIKNLIVDKHSYFNQIKEDVLWAGTDLSGRINKHIVILGYVEGLDYFIDAVRRESDIPIIICDIVQKIEPIKRVINRFEYVYQYVDEPRDVNCINKLNISAAHHVLIVSNITKETEGLDIDAILLASYIQEWYPNVKMTVEFQNENSIKMIETSLFSNYYIDTTKLYSMSFMSGRVLNSSLFLDIGSKLKTNPLQLKFLNDLFYNVIDESNILALKINEDLDGREYQSVYEEFLDDEITPLLCLGVFTSRFTTPIQDYLDKFLEVEPEYHEFKMKRSNASMMGYNSCENSKEMPLDEDDQEDYNFLINTLSVFLLNPTKDYILKQGDILYCLGSINNDKIQPKIQSTIIKTLRAYSSPTFKPPQNPANPDPSQEQNLCHKSIEKVLSELESRLLSNDSHFSH